jgi:hypothetical protein
MLPWSVNSMRYREQFAEYEQGQPLGHRKLPF